MQFDTLEAPGAEDCARCGDTPVCMGCVSGTAQPYYFLRCQSCGMIGPTGVSVEWAVSNWNGMPVYDGEKYSGQKHTRAYESEKPPVNEQLAALEAKIKAYNERKADKNGKAKEH